jgi:anti-sigma factor RsiW
MSREVPNARLCAFIDGECGPNQRAQMELALDDNPHLVDRLATWRRNDDALRFVFADAAWEPPNRLNARSGEPPGQEEEADPASAGRPSKHAASEPKGEPKSLGALALAMGLGAALAGAGSWALGLF